MGIESADIPLSKKCLESTSCQTSGKEPDGYMVQQVQTSCSECNQCTGLSVEVCSQAECKHLCYHMYSCDHQCYDYSNGHICKHILRAHSIWLQSNDIENTAVHPYLSHINSLLHNAVLTYKAAMSLDYSDVVGFKGDNIAANKNLDHQRTFKKTTKTPGRKRKGLVFWLVYT